MTIEEIKNRVQYGDYQILAEMLGVRSSVTAKSRFVRGNEEAKAAMELIITTREELIENFKKKK